MSENTIYQQPVYADLSYAPAPTKKTLWKRQNPLLQLVSFAKFNLKIMRMVVEGHQK